MSDIAWASSLLGGDASSNFSYLDTVVADNTASSDTWFSGLAKGFKGALDVVGSYIPVFTKSLLESQTEDQLQNPTFDRRFAPDRIGGRTFKVTTASNVDSGNNGGVPTGALIFGASLLVGTFFLYKSLS